MRIEGLITIFIVYFVPRFPLRLLVVAKQKGTFVLTCISLALQKGRFMNQNTLVALCLHAL